MPIHAPKIIRPLQLSFSHQVLEQDQRFYLLTSSTLGIRLDSGSPLLDLEYLEPTLSAMGANPVPDPGMPKPNGEFLVSGAFFAPEGQRVTGHEVKVRLGPTEKSLFVFGPRSWGPAGPTAPRPIAGLPLDYEHAFGGQGFAANPGGIGCADGLLPCIENPRQLIASPGDRPDPAGFAPRSPMHPSRMRYQPHYGEDYLKRYYPGYPAGFDWRYFLCAPEDQWIQGYFRGDEPFELHHLHPSQPVLRGRLPGLRARCFIRHGPPGQEPELAELPTNLDTVWFFPGKGLALLIWRGALEVQDDEASRVTHFLTAYEDSVQAPRSLDDYRAALERRLPGTDRLLNGLNTEDLIPPGHKCAMEILQERAQSQPRGSALARNIDAKAAATQALAEEKIAAALAEGERRMAQAGLPDAARADLRAALQPAPAPADPDQEALNRQLEAILPGILGKGSGKIQLKHFSFDQIGRIQEAVRAFGDRKQGLAMEELAKAKAQVRDQILQQEAGLAPEAREGLRESMKALEDLDTPALGKLPRVHAADLLAQLDTVPAQIARAGETMGGTPADPARPREALGPLEDLAGPQMTQIRATLLKAEADFKAVYRMGAHRMPEGLPPHAEPLDMIRARFLAAVAEGKPVAMGDWACLDLSGQDLRGLDLSGAYLEQVDFRGARLGGANLSGAILARANLEQADLAGANLEGANLGAVRAAEARFQGANLKSARLSKGQFARASFRGCDLEGAETMEIQADQADFSEARLPGLRILKATLKGTRFPGADLARACFLQGSLEDVDFSAANLQRSVWADMALLRVCFDGANLEAATFVATDPDQAGITGCRFQGARLDRGNYQNARMPGTNLDRASLGNANFAGADLAGASLRGAMAHHAQFRKANLAGADLDGIDLKEGSLAKADLVQAHVRGANLYSVDFLRATLGGTDFQGSNLDRTLLEDWRPE